MKFHSCLILYLLLSFSCFSAVHKLDWQRKIINYERGQYKGGSQNWLVAQSDNNWMYFANSNGLLEFDGVNWELYPVRNFVVRSVKIIDNKIYIGGSTEFGYFEKNSIGKLVYHSLSEKIEGWGGEVWNIIDCGNSIFFVSEHSVHTLNKKNRSIKSLQYPQKIDCSGLFNNTLYLGTSEGIFYLSDNNSSKLVPESKLLKGSKIANLCPYQDKLLITTSKNGLFLLDNLGKMVAMRSIADDFIKSNQLFSTAVSGTKIALGSVQDGLFIFDPESPTYKESFNLKNGLKNNTVLDCFFDKEQNLWLALDKGIAYIDLKSPIRPLFATISPIGTGYCSMIYNDELYLGTNQALYKVTKDGDYELVKKTGGQIWSLNIIEGKLFSSGDNGVSVISPTESYLIDIPGAWKTEVLSADKNKLIVGTYSGFCILKKDGDRWVFSHKIPYFIDSCRGFLEDEDIYNFWLTNTNSSVQKLTFDKDFTNIIAKKSYLLDNSSIGANSIFNVIDNNLVVCTDNGIYQYSRIADNFNRYDQLESKLEGDKYYDFLFLDNFKNIWFISDQQLKFIPCVDGLYKRKYNLGLADDLIGSYENIYLPDSLTAIVAADNAFSMIDLSQNFKGDDNIKPSIKTLSTTKNDSIICYGDPTNPIELSYFFNSVKIDFIATDFANASEVLYTYRLVGIEKDWSIPTSSTTKEYTNLPSGNYTFELKSFTKGNNIPTEVVRLSFKIKPPWYRSSIAYLVYIVCLLVLFFLFYKKTISKQKRIINQKGEELIAQSKKHQEETELKDKEIYELQNETLRNNLQHKTQQLNGHLLNVIRKNEMLESVKKKALNISKAIDEEKQTNLLRQKVMGLISLINSNIEHDNDFEVFQSNFDSMHHDFFKILDEKYPQFNRNDKVLCAYLKMNLSSKEIAPLLNISIRGVEISRYRLRKKMNLDRNENLSEFMNNLV